MNRPLSDEEIAWKFGVEPGTVEFEAAKRLSRNRVDRVICTLPEVTCPHCGLEFTACYEDVRHGREMPCECDRIIWIEQLVLPRDETSDEPVVITLTTEDTQDGKPHDAIVRYADE